MSDLPGMAAQLLTMHDDFVVLPTAWDAWSARALVDAGFSAITVGSHPVAASRGQHDNEGMSLDEALESVARITASVDVPVSADLESGYGAEPAELIERLLDAGAVGVNVEDTVHREGRMREPRGTPTTSPASARPPTRPASMSSSMRTDAFGQPGLHGRDPLNEAILLCELMEQAGARSLYPVKLPSREALAAILERVSLPVNVTAHPVTGSIAGNLDQTLTAGARRVSFGPRLQVALTDSISELVRPCL